ncbi:tryptophan/tyrosine permease [Desulfovibrio sulfodismutans]|uniref:Tryptophan/tyrosine permease n=1 Tax=Desulfolutivibrio sulfodismutans TaxID=63561 RepID=A0A7K3NJS3_9BACT|nr:aromatic amino acid transport family protein [Desulfolutivibrio sulfodismutans]NDY56442.1 tryptophan/tyrosine permease [Desulfolutivibrio sulfodismutans]
MTSSPATPQASLVNILSIGFLIVGNLIGAGILALPINTGLSGFIPSMFGLFLTSAAMFYSAIILSREAVGRQRSTFNFPSLYLEHLGVGGKWVAVVANLIILYGLLTAYLTGITAIINKLFDLNIPTVWLMLGFFLMTSLISLASVDKIMKYIAVIVVVKCGMFVVIAWMGGMHVKAANLSHSDWALFVCGIPILVTAFHFHNIIPAICESLRWNQKTINKTMLVGMSLGFAMNATWLLVGIGVLPLDNSPVGLINAFEQNLPATIPLAQIMNSETFLILAGAFSLAAITTAYLANGLGLIGFMDDLTNQFTGRTNPILSRALAFLPPLLIALVYPDIFLEAINFAGGFGIVTLFGILPSIIAIRRARTPVEKGLGVAMLVLFALFFLAEAGQEFGMLKITPETEHWQQ